MIKKAMIMAAGVGTRLDPLTQRIPKPMITVANKPIMELILSHLWEFGIKDVIANTHYLAETIHERFSGNNDLGINFNYIKEQELSGTAGGVKKCESFFDDDETFIVISGDALTDVNIHNLVKKHKSKGALATIALREVPKEEVSHFGVVILDQDSNILEFQEKPSIKEARSNLVNTGIYVFEKRIFDYIPENMFYDFAKNVFPAIMENKEIFCGHTINEYWNDIGTLNQYRLSSYDVLSNKISIDPHYPKSSLGWCSDKSEISSRISCNGKIVVGDHTIIENNVKLLGNCIIGDNCIIKKGAQLRNAIIWDNVVIEEGAKLDGCIVANGAKICGESIIMPGQVVPYGHTISLDKELFSAKNKTTL